MLSFFDSMPQWARNDGSLHVYALPDEATADRLDELSARLEGLTGLPRQPRTWLHATISRLAQFDDLGQAGLSALAEELGRSLAGMGGFTVDLGAPEVVAGAVVCAGEPTAQWSALVDVVRGAALRFNPEPLPPAPALPHVSLAYATAEVDDAEVGSRIGDAPALGAFAVRAVHLVSVTARPELGSFDWTELANWEL